MAVESVKAVFKHLDDQLYDLLGCATCTVCHELFKDPVTTSCCHSFCQSCLKRAISNRNNQCPLCKNPVNRRELYTDEARSTLSKIFSQLPSAFKEDVSELESTINQPLQDFISTSKVCQFNDNETLKTNKAVKHPKQSTKVKNADAESFVPVLKRGEKVLQYLNKKKSDELISISQVDVNSDANIVLSGRTSKKLKSIKKLPTNEKITNWLETAKDDLMNDSLKSIFGEVPVNKDKEVQKVVELRDERKSEAQNHSPMVRVDYKKSTLIATSSKDMKPPQDTDSGDPYEFIASQHSKVPKKKRKKSTIKKKAPDFFALQNFTKESVKRNALLMNQSSDNDSDKANCIEPDLEIVNIERASSGETTTESREKISASQKFEQLLCETNVPEPRRHTLYSPTQAKSESLACSYQSDLPLNATLNFREKSTKKRKNSMDLPEDNCIANLFVTPQKVENCETNLEKKKNDNQKQKRNSNFVPRNSKRQKISLSNNENNAEVKTHAQNSNASKKTKLVELLEEILIDPTIHQTTGKGEIRNKDSDEFQIDDSTDPMLSKVKADDKSVTNLSDMSKSPGWSRVSGLKNDFEIPKRHSIKSLNVSGGEQTGNSSKNSSKNGSMEQIEIVDLPHTDTYIEDLSQSSNLLLGFPSQKDKHLEESFMKMVEDMEQELDDHLTTMINKPQLSLEKPKELKSPLAPHINEEFPVPVLSSMKVKGTKAIMEKGKKEEKREEKRRSHSKSIPFTLLGKIKRKKNCSVVFLQLGRLTPLLRRSRSTVVKLIFPKHGYSKRRSKPVTFSTGVQTCEIIQSSSGGSSPRLNTSCHSGGVQTSQKAIANSTQAVTSTSVQTSQVKITSAEMQTSQAVPIQTLTTGMQTTLPVAVSSFAQTSQILATSAEAQTSHIGRPLSIGMQTSQRQTRSAFAQTSQPLQVSQGVQMSQSSKKISKSPSFTSDFMPRSDEMKAWDKLAAANSQPESKNELPESGWTDCDVLEKMNSQSLLASNELPIERKEYNKGELINDFSLINTQLQNEFDQSWEKATEKPKSQSQTKKKGKSKKGTQSLISSFCSAKSSDSQEVRRLPRTQNEEEEDGDDSNDKHLSNIKTRRVRRISSGDLDSPNDSIFVEGRQFLQLDIRKSTNKEENVTINLVTQKEPLSEDNIDSQELLQRVFNNIDMDLNRGKDSEELFEDDLVSKANKAKAQNSEESDSDMFVEQTPPKPRNSDYSFKANLSKTRISLHNASSEKMTEKVQKNSEGFAVNTEGTDIIACTILNTEKNKVNEVNEVNDESFLMLTATETNKITTPKRKEEKPKESKASAEKTPFKIPISDFPSKESFFKGHTTSEQISDENNQNKLNSSVEKRTTEKKVISETRSPMTKSLSNVKKICVVASSVKNPSNIEKFVNKFKIEYSNKPVKHMTHLIVGLHEDDDEPLPFCTPKLLFAMANKKWIVSETWVETCLKLNSILPEEPFESLDPVGGCGCKMARLSTEPLLKDCEIYLLGDFEMISKEEFSDLIIDCGGTLVQQPEKFSFLPGKLRMIVADRDCLQVDENHVQALFEKYKTAVLSRDVIIMSIQSYKLVNFTPHLLTLTSEEELTKLGYPYLLVKHEDESEWSNIK